MWLVELNYNFDCDWIIELADNKVSDNNLKSEFVKPITIEGIEIFMINWFKEQFQTEVVKKTFFSGVEVSPSCILETIPFTTLIRSWFKRHN